MSAGVGFAIPIDAARGVVGQIIEFGQVQRAILGISYAPPLCNPGCTPSLAAVDMLPQVYWRSVLGVASDAFRECNSRWCRYLERLPTALEAEKSGIPRIEKGVVVLEVPPTSPAAAAGLVPVSRPPEKGAKPILGDVIVGIDKFPIQSPADLSEVAPPCTPSPLSALHF